MTRTDAIAAFIAEHGTNAPGMFIGMMDNPTTIGRYGDSTFATLYAMVNTDSDIDEIVEEMDELINA